MTKINPASEPEYTFADVKRGDLIELTKGKEIIRGVVEYTAVGGPRLRILTQTVSVSEAMSTGFALTLIDRPVKVPTEVGLYVDREGDEWYLDHHGMWWWRYHDTNDGWSKTSGAFKPEAYLPFRRFGDPE